MQIRPEEITYQGGCIYELYQDDMHVPARIVAPENSKDQLLQDQSLQQIANVASLPGVQRYPWVMPDMHEGYGFPIGGVAAMDWDDGVISPGGIGYDINCGVRLLVTNIRSGFLAKNKRRIAEKIQSAIPSGLGGAGPIPLSAKALRQILADGAHAPLAWGFGTREDVAMCESNGVMEAADPHAVSKKAIERGKDQLATLGSGNHFLEIQSVSDIYDKETAKQFGLEEDMVTIMIHCGSRGIGHQICTDYVKEMLAMQDTLDIHLPDPALACAPISSQIGQSYYAAMSAAANFAWANRHIMTHSIRTILHDVYGASTHVATVYDISHNIGKKEQHHINHAPHNLIVHRKGATRAFGPNAPDVPNAYQSTGHPVLVPGTMGTSSFVMVGRKDNLAFGSCCHGAGRVMSRRKARQTVDTEQLRDTLEQFHVSVYNSSQRGFVEEAPQAYKDVINVVNTVSCAHLADPVARMTPRIVIKG